jgi:ribosomal-protein-alanine N-acetyltransferase
MIIRTATVNDIPRLFEIEKQFGDEAFTENQFIYMFKKHKIFCALVNNQIAGYCCCVFRKNTNSGRLYSLIVDKQYRGLGIGSKLLDKVEQYCIENKKQSVTLEVSYSNVAALNLYSKSHYKQTAHLKDYYRMGESAIKMKKVL